MARPYGSIIHIESEPSPIAGPAAVLSKDAHSKPDLPTAYELEELSKSSRAVPKYPNGAAIPPTPSGAQTPSSPPDLETSRPPSPVHDTFDVLQTLTNPPINKWRVLSCALSNFGGGLNDSAPGALIPYMEKDYQIGYAVVSLIFVTNALGFISATPFVQAVQGRLGRARSLACAQLVTTAGYVMLITRPPFPVVVVAFYLLGFGLAFNLAINNTFCANLANNTTILGFFHGGYGIGGTIGPLIATSLVNNSHPWSTFYFIALGVSVLNLVIFLTVFRNYERDTPPSTQALNPTASNPNGTTSRTALLKQALRNRTTLFGALFIFAYQGAEVSISGWVISFLISYRHSSPSHVGYVTSGFWAGITLGRFLLSHPAHRVGEKRAVLALIFGATAFQLLVWLVPNVIGEAVAVAIVGLLLGPIYPCATAVYAKLIPARLQMSSLAAISALGSSGGAVAPFFTGLLAQEVGTWVLHPICVGLFAGMVGCWVALPRIERRTV